MEGFYHHFEKQYGFIPNNKTFTHAPISPMCQQSRAQTSVLQCNRYQAVAQKPKIQTVFTMYLKASFGCFEVVSNTAYNFVTDGTLQWGPAFSYEVRHEKSCMDLNKLLFSLDLLS